MAQTTQRVEYYSVEVADKPGVGAALLNALKTANVGLAAYTGFPAGPRRSQMDFVPVDKNAFLAAAKAAGIKVDGPKAAFLVQGDDQTGAAADVLTKLADAHINVTAMDAVAAGQGRYAAILWVKPRNVRRAAEVLGAR